MRSTACGLAGAQNAFSTGVVTGDGIQNFPNLHQGHAEVVPGGIHKLGGSLHPWEEQSHTQVSRPSLAQGVTGEGEEWPLLAGWIQQ